jgi:hypothetical protein
MTDSLCVVQVGVFGQVEQFQRELDRIAGLLDSDDEEAMGELVHGEQRHDEFGCVLRGIAYTVGAHQGGAGAVTWLLLHYNAFQGRKASRAGQDLKS